MKDKITPIGVVWNQCVDLHVHISSTRKVYWTAILALSISMHVTMYFFSSYYCFSFTRSECVSASLVFLDQFQKKQHFGKELRASKWLPFFLSTSGHVKIILLRNTTEIIWRQIKKKNPYSLLYCTTCFPLFWGTAESMA